MDCRIGFIVHDQWIYPYPSCHRHYSGSPANYHWPEVALTNARLSRVFLYPIQLLIAVFLVVFCLISVAKAEEEGGPQLVRLQEHKPIYFLIGEPDTKIQFSFKVQFFQRFNLYLAYTQLVMWDAFKVSSPVRDINYDPEIFYRIFIKKDSNRWIDLGFIEHESNGLTGATSRSWNRIYVLYHSTQKLSEHIKLPWSIKGWIPSYQNPTDRDIPKYRGMWELQVTLTDFLGSFFGDNDLLLRLYPGGKYYTNPLAGGQELTLRSKATIKALSPVVVFQLFHGYGENMLDYQHDRFGIRIGIGF